MAGLLRPPSTVFSAPRCSPPPSWWSPRRPAAAARHRAPRIRSSSTSESSPSTTTAPSQSTTTAKLKLTYLEFNGWVWELDGGFRILVDPILDGNLDFGIPWLFDAAKKTLKTTDDGLQVDLGGIDLLLITQSLDDHCHLRTLTRISAAAPGLPVVTTPNAQPIISALPFTNVTYLEPGQSTAVDGGNLEVLATAGPVLGPPWQRPENGYILTTTAGQHKHRLYYEPHCVYDAAFLRDRGLRADVVITPVVRQLLPANFTLVSGQEDAVDLAKQLRPSHVVPMSNAPPSSRRRAPSRRSRLCSGRRSRRCRSLSPRPASHSKSICNSTTTLHHHHRRSVQFQQQQSRITS